MDYQPTDTLIFQQLPEIAFYLDKESITNLEIKDYDNIIFHCHS